MSPRRFVAIAGLSGAGKSQAMKSFEDLGFFCSDNVPPAMAPELVDLARRAGYDHLAIALDVRTHGPFGDALQAITELRARGDDVELLFLEANDAAIVRRYSETRRRHPFEQAGLRLADAIARERVRLEPLRASADRIWDTSTSTQTSLKARIVAAFGAEAHARQLSLNVTTFGFKFGIPLDADMVFDVRFLPNPNYENDLRELTGRDAAVAAYMEAQPATGEFLRHLYALLDFLIPLYVEEGKARLTIAIGCTGGRHRSVYVAERLVDHLGAPCAVAVALEHRELLAV
jgi:UPF0042 nucleotide-binding protein